MEPKRIYCEGFTIVGVEARTSNAKEFSGQGIIPAQWARVMGENLLSQITHKNDPRVFAVYTNYDFDKDGEYTFLIGVKVDSIKDIPVGMVAHKIPSGYYAVFTSAKGIVSQVVVDAWMDVWNVPQGTLGSDRLYHSDFEVYDERALDPGNTQVDIYIGLKK